jgi:hypothetical protein
MAPLCYRRHRFPPEIIQHAIWLYLRSPNEAERCQDRACGIAQLGGHIALHPAWAQHHRPEDQLAQRRLKQRSSKEGLGAGLPRINSFRRGGDHPEFFHFPAGR